MRTNFLFSLLLFSWEITLTDCSFGKSSWDGSICYLIGEDEKLKSLVGVEFANVWTTGYLNCCIPRLRLLEKERWFSWSCIRASSTLRLAKIFCCSFILRYYMYHPSAKASASSLFDGLFIFFKYATAFSKNSESSYFGFFEWEGWKIMINFF